ncbi:MAG TPA: hypothetical protein VF792_01820 [Ktedonobacterales bacterium]
MAMQVIVHVINEEAFVAEMEELPAAGLNYVVLTNPRTRENKHLQWAQSGAVRYLFPMTRIAFIEVMMSEQDREGIEPFYRERSR